LSNPRHSSKIISLKEDSFLKNKFDKDRGKGYITGELMKNASKIIIQEL